MALIINSYPTSISFYFYSSHLYVFRHSRDGANFLIFSLSLFFSSLFVYTCSAKFIYSKNDLDVWLILLVSLSNMD